MKVLKIIGISIIWFCGSALNTLAYSIDKIGVEDGLSNNNVVSIAQDHDGFIWFGTKDGLNRFDGSNFKIFKTSGPNTNSISSNALNYVYADRFDDVVWIATEKNGLDAYNYRKNVFTHYENESGNSNSLSANGVTHISSDSRGNLWLATYQGGIEYFDKETGIFTHYNQSTIRGLGSDYNWTLMVDKDEKVYAGHVNNGFSIINLETMTAVNFQHDPQNSASLADNTVTCIFKDSRNNIWIGTRNGLSLFDPETYQIKTFKNNPENPSSLSHNFIQKVIETTDHELWIGIEGGGINILDLKEFSNESDPDNVIFRHIQASYTPDGLSSPSVQCLKQDAFGNIWSGGLGGGINFISHQDPFFRKYTYMPIIGYENSLNAKIVLGLCIDRENMLWVANGFGGISIYNKEQKIKHIDNIDDRTGKKFFNCILKDSDDHIWIGTDKSIVYYYDIQTERFSDLTCFDDLPNVVVYNLFEDSKKNIWLSTDYGLYAYNRITKECKSYNTDNSGLSDNVIRAVSEDSHGNLWVGTLIGGLCVFNEDFQLIFNYGTIYDFYGINHIYRDSKNRMWIGSQNDLFLFKNYTNDSIVRIGRDFGLNETNIRSIVEGKSSNDIWISTTSGISHIDLNNNSVSNFSVNDNIAMGDYLNGSVAKSDDGTICFGSQNGATWFNQDADKFNDIILPNIVFTSFSITDYKKNINEFIDIPFSDVMELNHHQNSFQIYFNVLDYALSDKVEFAYQIKGIGNEWYLIDTDKRVTFRNLKPGNYLFSVKARLHNGDWQNEIRSMTVKILPPFWLRWWAISIYSILLILTTLFIVRFYRNKLKIENDLLLEKKSRQQEHELNEEKLKFFTNITHELRTPMTLILGPLEDLITDNSMQPEQLKKVNSIHRVANRLLQLINQILEFRKTQNKNRKLRVAKDDLVKYVHEIGLKYQELNQKSAIELQMDLPEEKIEMFFDPEVIMIILDNLLSNAYKYTKEGHIRLELRNYTEASVDYTEIIVSDTGFGISPEDLPFIFERYYQAKHASHPVKGTGIGLALVQNLVELHEAGISVNSQPGTGSTFRVRFITNNTYPDVIHLSPGEVQTEQQEQEIDSEKVVLVVDDNQEIVEYIQDSLIDTYMVITAENGKAGLDLASEKVPDIVICDIMMPVMDGLEMCRMMKQDIRTSHIPIILLTAKDSTLDKSEGYKAGADSYLTKPFSINLLKSRLTNILNTREKLSSGYSTNFKNKQKFFNESTNKLDKEFLEKLTEVIEKNLEDEEMNISYIASQMNMSHSTLYRKIKALTNLTANEYIRKVRINFGEQLMLTNQYSVSEIMYRIGINSSSYFRQCFREEFGMNPQDYLQKLKNE